VAPGFSPAFAGLKACATIVSAPASRSRLLHLCCDPELEGAADARDNPGARPDAAVIGAGDGGRRRRSIARRSPPERVRSKPFDGKHQRRASRPVCDLGRHGLTRERAIVLIAEPGREEEAATRLGRIGFDEIAGYSSPAIGGSWFTAQVDTDRQLRLAC
jgi:hypothetical protein